MSLSTLRQSDDFGPSLDDVSKVDLVSTGVDFNEDQLVAPKTPRKSAGKEVVKQSSKGNALSAVKDEAAEVKTKVFTFDGEQWTMPSAEDWDLEVFELVEDQKIVSAVRMILGEKQWTKFKSKKRKAEDLMDMFVEIQKRMGVEDPE